MKHVKWLCAVYLIILSSCSLQKRLYNKGFYASKTHSLKRNDVDTSSLLSNIKPGKEKLKQADLVASNAKKSTFNTQHSTFLADCDTIVLTDGTKIFVKITEVHSNKIKFKYCNSNEEVFSISKADINYIVYSNGKKESIKYKPNMPDYYQQPKKTNPFTIAGFVLSIIEEPVTFFLIMSFDIGWIFLIPFVLLLLTITFCITAIIQISKNRESQKGLALSIIGLVLSIIVLFILIGSLLV